MRGGGLSWERRRDRRERGFEHGANPMNSRRNESKQASKHEQHASVSVSGSGHISLPLRPPFPTPLATGVLVCAGLGTCVFRLIACFVAYVKRRNTRFTQTSVGPAGRVTRHTRLASQLLCVGAFRVVDTVAASIIKIHVCEHEGTGRWYEAGRTALTRLGAARHESHEQQHEHI